MNINVFNTFMYMYFKIDGAYGVHLMLGSPINIFGGPHQEFGNFLRAFKLPSTYF